MKRITGFTLAILAAMGMWSCSTSYMAQKGEYDDMYYSSKDRQVDSYSDVNFNEYSSYKEDANPTRINGDETLSQDSYSAKTVNPDYVEKYNTDETAVQADSDQYGEGEYYVEDHDAQTPVVNNYYGYNPYRYNYYALYYPFYDPFYYPWYGPYRISYSYYYGYGCGWSRWNNSYFYDPYWGYTPSYCYTALYYPSSGYYYGGYYGSYGYSPWNYYNSIYYNNAYVNVNPDNISKQTRKIVRGPRPSRSEVSDLTNNTPTRSVVSRSENPRTRTSLDSNSPSQSSYYRRTRNDEIRSTGSLDGQRTEYSRTRAVSNNLNNSRPSTNYVRPRTTRSSLDYNRNTNSYQPKQRSVNINSRSVQRSSSTYRNYNYNKSNAPSYRQNNYRRSSPVQINRSTNRSYQYNRSSTPTRSVTPSHSVTPTRSSPSRSSGSTRSGSSNSRSNSSSSSRRGHN